MNVLLISPKFHNYANIFIQRLYENKHFVKYINISLNLSIFDRGIVRISTKFLKKRFAKVLNTEISKLKGLEFDRIVVIFGGTCFTKENYFQLKEEWPNAEFIYYNWDSVKNNFQSLEYYKLFDKYYSFDIEDCNKYGYKLLSTWYSYVNPINNDTKYDFGSLMTFGQKKVKSYVKVKNVLSNELVGKEYLIMPNKGSYLYNKIKYHKQFKHIDKKNIYHKWLPLEEATNFYNDCKAVIDIPLEGQNGLTTRTFEVLKQEKKLITTNKAIKQYEFYTPNNIFVVDENTKEIPKEFFETPFDKNYCISEKYSLESFVKTLFDLDNE